MSMKRTTRESSPASDRLPVDDAASTTEQTAATTEADQPKPFLNDEEERRLDRLQWGGMDWGEAVHDLYIWLQEDMPPLKLYHLAREARYRINGRFHRLSGLNQSSFELELKDILADLEGIMQQTKKAITDAEQNDSPSIPEARRIVVIPPISSVVRIFEAMREAGIIAKKTPVRDLIAHCFIERSTTQITEARYNSTKQKIAEGSKAKGSEMLEFVKLLSASLKRDDIEKLAEHLEHLQRHH